MSDLIQVPGIQFITRLGDEGRFDPKDARIGNADAYIKIGGFEDLTKFIPNINISKWDDEFFLNINTVGVQKGDVKSFKRGKIVFEQSGIQHRYYPTTEKRPKLEYEMIFASKPSSLEVWFDLLHSDGLLFGRQIDFIPGSIYAPNVPGSYVVYTPAGGEYRNNKYRTGKICQFYMPELIDDIGRRIFVEKFEIENGKMLIVLPDTWMENAVYPVRLDPLVGTNNIGASFYEKVDYQLLNGDNLATGSATATTAYIYTPTAQNTGGPVKIHLYEGYGSGVVVDHTVEILEGAQATDDWSSTAISWSVVAGNAMSLSTNLHGMRYDLIGTGRFAVGLPYPDHPESPYTGGPNTVVPSVYIDEAGGQTINLAAASTISSTTSTPILSVLRPLAASSVIASTTSTPALAVERLLAAVATIATQTSSPVLAVERLLAAGSTIATQTSMPVLAVERLLAASIIIASTTSSPALGVLRSLVAASAISSATSTPVLAVQRLLAAASVIATVTSDITLITSALGVILDPTIDSLTVVRELESLTTERTFTSLTPERTIEEL